MIKRYQSLSQTSLTRQTQSYEFRLCQFSSNKGFDRFKSKFRSNTPYFSHSWSGNNCVWRGSDARFAGESSIL